MDRATKMECESFLCAVILREGLCPPASPWAAAGAGARMSQLEKAGCASADRSSAQGNLPKGESQVDTNPIRGHRNVEERSLDQRWSKQTLTDFKQKVFLGKQTFAELERISLSQRNYGRGKANWGVRANRTGQRKTLVLRLRSNDRDLETTRSHTRECLGGTGARLARYMRWQMCHWFVSTGLWIELNFPGIGANGKCLLQWFTK